jgi:hypothetical protein
VTYSLSTSAEEVFTDMQPLVRSVLDGFNVCIFAYGQTGSGKTFTMVLNLSIVTFYMIHYPFCNMKTLFSGWCRVVLKF